MSKFLYRGYDILNKGMLNTYYTNAKDRNGKLEPYKAEEIEALLNHWGFNPVLEKNPLMNKEDVKKWLEKIDQRKVKSWAYTGGSYGEPFRVPYSKKRALVKTATFKYFNEMGGYQLGDPFVLIRAKSKSSILQYLRNETIFIPKDLSEKRIRSLLDTLRKKKVKVLLGYPTVMYDLALYLKNSPEEKKGLQVETLISASEPLPDFLRELIKEQFGCSFIDRYSNEEVGLIAQQREYAGEHFVNKYGVLVEVVNPDSLKPVKEGEQGKVVVTDLYNELLPIIRYDTGDLAVAHKYKDGQLLSITDIAGRVTEKIFAISGSPVSPLILGPYIYIPLSKEGTVFQYQFAQTNKTKYELRIKTMGNEIPVDVLESIRKGLMSVLGDSAEISFNFPDDILPQPSGKRPVFKNEMEST